jgi:hypothetical protein
VIFAPLVGVRSMCARPFASAGRKCRSEAVCAHCLTPFPPSPRRCRAAGSGSRNGLLAPASPTDIIDRISRARQQTRCAPAEVQLEIPAGNRAASPSATVR